MGSIKATYSAIETYTGKCGDNYRTLLAKAYELLDRVERMHNEVQRDYDSISRQVMDAQRLSDELLAKLLSYQNQMDYTMAEVNSQTSTIQYLYSNPRTVTIQDSNGESYTVQEYDTAGIRNAERRRDEAYATYRLYSEKRDAATEVYHEAQAVLMRYQNIQKAIHMVSEAIESDVLEIKKHIRVLEDETEYNIHALQGVIGSLRTYLASKAIYAPTGAR